MIFREHFCVIHTQVLKVYCVCYPRTMYLDVYKHSLDTHMIQIYKYSLRRSG